MVEQQTGTPMDQEHMLHPIDEGVAKHDLCEWDAGADSFPPPFQAPKRKVLFDRRVERLDQPAERPTDGLANRRTDNREDGICQRFRIPSDRLANGFLDGRHQGLAELLILPGPQNDSLRQKLAHLLRVNPELVDPFPETQEFGAFIAEQEILKGREIVSGAYVIGGVVGICRGTGHRVSRHERSACRSVCVG